MELRVGHGTRGPLSRRLDTGGASPRWGYGADSEGRTFEEDLALLEGQILAENLDRERTRAALSTTGPRRRETAATD